MQKNDDNERLLLQQVAEGHRPSFTVLYDRYWKRIYATSLHYLKSSEWAQDLVQDIFEDMDQAVDSARNRQFRIISLHRRQERAGVRHPQTGGGCPLAGHG
ncbi:RNA polymerase sigma factor [Puia sp. P3]|uniref:RNA polymerase sigma factor n=1 Tax=Puia sp. P3 TaxID=3423952 RepID=UPI003D679912